MNSNDKHGDDTLSDQDWELTDSEDEVGFIKIIQSLKSFISTIKMSTIEAIYPNTINNITLKMVEKKY